MKNMPSHLQKTFLSLLIQRNMFFGSFPTISWTFYWWSLENIILNHMNARWRVWILNHSWIPLIFSNTSLWFFKELCYELLRLPALFPWNSSNEFMKRTDNFANTNVLLVSQQNIQTHSCLMFRVSYLWAPPTWPFSSLSSANLLSEL